MRPRKLSVDPRAIAIAIVLLAGVGAPALAEGQAARTVLTIYWGAESFPGTDRLDAAIRDVLLKHTDVRVNYFAEYLETEDFPPETASAALRDYIQRKYKDRHIDVVIAVASAAFQFALRYRSELFPDTPIVFSAVTPPDAVINHTAAGVTGVLIDGPFSETLNLALTLQPSTKRVFVVAQALS